MTLFSSTSKLSEASIRGILELLNPTSIENLLYLAHTELEDFVLDPDYEQIRRHQNRENWIYAKLCMKNSFLDQSISFKKHLSANITKNVRNTESWNFRFSRKRPGKSLKVHLYLFSRVLTSKSGKKIKDIF